jgi:hypothetical protein
MNLRQERSICYWPVGAYQGWPRWIQLYVFRWGMSNTNSVTVLDGQDTDRLIFHDNMVC